MHITCSIEIPTIYAIKNAAELPIKINTSILGTPIFIDLKALFPKYCIPIIYTGKHKLN